MLPLADASYKRLSVPLATPSLSGCPGKGADNSVSLCVCVIS